MKSSSFNPELGGIIKEIQSIQQSCLQNVYTKNRGSNDHRPPADLDSLPTELLDQILSYLSASSAVAFKLISRRLHRTEPPLPDVLVNPCFDRQEAFRTKCYLESLSPRENLQYMICSGCMRVHHAKHFSMRQRVTPATQRKCYGTSGFQFFGQSIIIPPDERKFERPSRGPKSVPPDGVRLLLVPTERQARTLKGRSMAIGRKRTSSYSAYVPRYRIKVHTGSDGPAEMRLADLRRADESRLRIQSANMFGKRTRSRSCKRHKSLFSELQ